jgi:uncharacterized damage-inducible protein DinB
MKSCAPFDFPPQEGDTGAPPTVDALRNDETYVQTQIQRVLPGLTEANLSRMLFREKGGRQDHDRHIPVREALWHLVEEEPQHRGELNALLWKIDIDAPIVRWIKWDHAVGRIMYLPSQPGES